MALKDSRENGSEKVCPHGEGVGLSGQQKMLVLHQLLHLDHVWPVTVCLCTL